MSFETDDPPGTLSVLNVRAGDLKLSFDPADPAEVERARRTVEDMLRRGYTILVEVGGELRKAEGFDPERCEYLIQSPPEGTTPGPKGRRGRPKGVPAGSTRATAIAPTAAG